MPLCFKLKNIRIKTSIWVKYRVENYAVCFRRLNFDIFWFLTPLNYAKFMKQLVLWSLDNPARSFCNFGSSLVLLSMLPVSLTVLMSDELYTQEFQNCGAIGMNNFKNILVHNSVSSVNNVWTWQCQSIVVLLLDS